MPTQSHDHPVLLRTLQRFENAIESLQLTLPKSLTDALGGMHKAGRHLDKCHIEGEEARLAEGRIEGELLSENIEAVSAGRAARIDVGPVFKAREQAARLSVEQNLLTRTFESGIVLAHAELLDSAEPIIVKTLRPRLSALLKDAKELVKPLGNVTTPGEALNAGEKASTSWRKLSSLAETWGKLSHVYVLLYALAFDGLTQDASG